jgi:hypothetical protein
MLRRRHRAEDPETKSGTHARGRRRTDAPATATDPMELLSASGPDDASAPGADDLPAARADSLSTAVIDPVELPPPPADDPMALLSTPVADDDLTAALARRPKVRLPSLTLTLTAVAVASLGFLGGALVGKHFGSSSSASASAFARFALASPGAGSTSSSTGFAGRSGLFGGSGGATVGTIKLVDGNIVYVQTEAGDIIQVSTSAATKITVSSSAPVKDLLPGETIIVEGSKKANGSIAATSISQNSLGLGAGG